MTELDERIKQAEERLKQLKARKQQLEARKRAIEAKKNRSDDTRRKILLGAAILQKVESGEWKRERMLALLDAMLTRPADRALFGLDAKEEPEKANSLTTTEEGKEYREDAA